jgi:AAA15 family ATPase/GTPase
MRLIEFRIRNYRSINDSGPIEIRQRTALVGRNESGKTNLLLALESLNPPSRALAALSYVKDFPRDRNADEYSEDLIVVETKYNHRGKLEYSGKRRRL